MGDWTLVPAIGRSPGSVQTEAEMLEEFKRRARPYVEATALFDADWLAIAQQYGIPQALALHYASTGLKFTLDGRLVGDIAEALALDHFELVSPSKRTKGVDAFTTSGDTVQIKATGRPNAGPAFTRGQGFARYLLFFRIDFEAGKASIIYNGPEAAIRALLPTVWEGTYVINLAAVTAAASNVAKHEMLPTRLTSLA
ncbi:conserved hypothetical protein [Ricinus communis]|uniref:FRG domain-containing protein n=1 Tax=Ricinus communis TaxID=3988 RepID=B9THA2_RICCO|nr:conserved hypothetical protein [Ricinus communis]